jgi:anion-transporting  ArsA/GET3 family ATPase
MDLGVAYDRVLIDTAPTGHTLRLLSAPDFLNALLGKLTGLRTRLGGALGMGATLFGLDVAALNGKLDAATATLESYRTGGVGGAGGLHPLAWAESALRL